MIPVRLELKNFMSYGEQVTPLDFHGMHIACLSGDNGNGKSALLDAITGAHPGMPIAADVLVGNAAGETFYAARGFAPEEDVDEELGGEHVRERRWWLRP